MRDVSKVASASSGVSPEWSDIIMLGRIVGAHGIRGEVVVHSFAAVPEDIAAYGGLTDKAGARAFKLRVLRLTPKGAVIARIAGVADRTAAEALKGVELYIAREKLPEPEDGAFYYADLVGLAAVSADGAPLGLVVAVQNYGAGDLLEIKLTAKNDTELVPFNDTFVPVVDVPGRKVVVLMPVTAGEDEKGAT